MLKSPALKATATDTPHKISGVALLIVAEIARNDPNEPTTSAQYALPTVRVAPMMSPFCSLLISDKMMMKAPTTIADNTASSVIRNELVRAIRSGTLRRVATIFMRSPRLQVANQPCINRRPLPMSPWGRRQQQFYLGTSPATCPKVTSPHRAQCSLSKPPYLHHAL